MVAPSLPCPRAPNRLPQRRLAPSDGARLRHWARKWALVLALIPARPGAARADVPVIFLPDYPPPAPGHTDLQLHGYVQADAVAWAQDSEDQLAPSTSAPLNQERFLIRRARLEADVRRGPLLGWIELDANTINGPAIGLASAEISYLLRLHAPPPSHAPMLASPGAPTPGAEPTVTEPEPMVAGPSPATARPDLLMASMGLLRTPFGAELQERDRDRLFLERSNVGRALFPGAFDLAARVQARWRVLLLQVALSNGNPAGSGQYALQDPTAAKDLVGRMGVALASSGARALRLEAGVSFLRGTGFHPGTPATKDVLVWQDENGSGIVQPSEIEVIPGSPATPSSDFHRFAAGCDLRVSATLVRRLGELSAFGEVIWAANLDRGLIPADPVASGRDVRELGLLAGATQELGHHLIFGARYDYYDADLDSFAALPIRVVPSSSVFSTTAFIMAWRFSSVDRFAVELDLNRNPLGRGNNGLPANLPSDTLTARAQLAF